MRMTPTQKKLASFLRRTVGNPSFSFLLYFALVAVYGFLGRDILLIYGFVAPWLLLVILLFNLPFFRVLFRGVDLSDREKINHVLEHGTIHFLKLKYGRRHRMSGRALSNGFRIGGVLARRDIREAFDMVLERVRQDTAIVLSRYCGSNTPVLQGVVLLFLTLTLLWFLFLDTDPLTVKLLLLANLLFYVLLRYPIERYFQKRFTMSFQFSDARIVAVNRAHRDSPWECTPMYLVKTEVTPT